jgi:hypothetical protein
MVKYFTPHCRYCRFLKKVFDDLKEERTWNMKFYDFNCNWYPEFCNDVVGISSFPYVGIYGPSGELVESMHGYYPEPVVRELFEKIH